MGTPSFAVPALRAVAQACDLVAVVTRPDRPRGRGKGTTASEVAVAAEELGAPVLKTEDVHGDASLERLSPDLFAVVAFGAILSPALLRVPKLGSINLHGSLLPDYRGASPVQRALWEGRAWTGVTTLWMDEGVDTGDVILQRWAPIESEDDAASLGAKLAQVGAPLVAQSLVLAHQGKAPRHSQDRTAGSYAGRLRKSDGAVDWSRDAVAIWNHQRAVTPWPGAQSTFRGRGLLLTRTSPAHLLAAEALPGAVLGIEAGGVLVACSSGALLIRSVKPEGRAEMPAADWARGARIEIGDRLGEGHPEEARR